MKNAVTGFILIVVIFVLSWFVGSQLQNQNNEAFQPITDLSCQSATPECKASFSDATLEIVLIPPIVVMSPIDVKMTSPADITDAYLQFRMKNMDMGIQRYRLVSVDKGLWQSEVILPVCSLGRSDWIATLEVKYQNVWWQVDFAFEAASQ